MDAPFSQTHRTDRYLMKHQGERRRGTLLLPPFALDVTLIWCTGLSGEHASATPKGWHHTCHRKTKDQITTVHPELSLNDRFRVFDDRACSYCTLLSRRPYTNFFLSFFSACSRLAPAHTYMAMDPFN